MKLNSEKRLGCKLCFIVHRQSETLFAPLNIKGIMLEMQPRMQHVFTQRCLLLLSSCNENCNIVIMFFKTAGLWKFVQLFLSCSIQTDRLEEANKWFLQHFAVNVPKTEYDTVSALLTVRVLHQNVCFHFLLTISIVASLYRRDIARGCFVLRVALHCELNDNVFC
jgi:hypothetical protein